MGLSLLVLIARITLLSLVMEGLDRRRIGLAALFYGVLVPPFLLAAQVVYLSNALLYARPTTGGPC